MLVKTAVTGRHVAAGAHIPEYGCNNLGVVIHGNHCRRPMMEKQAPADVLCLFKSLVSSSRIGGRMYHVRGHVDNLFCQDQMSVEERVNCRADKLASEALVKGVVTQHFISSNIPFKNTRLLVKGRTVTGSPKNAFTQSWGARITQKLFHQRNIVGIDDFNLVYWEGMEKVMKSFPEMFRVWVTKQVSHFNETNHQLAQIDCTRKI